MGRKTRAAIPVAKTAQITVNFDFPMKRSDFSTLLELQRYQSRCRESELKCELTRLHYQLKNHGLTKDEWMGVLADCLLDATRRREGGGESDDGDI